MWPTLRPEPIGWIFNKKSHLAVAFLQTLVARRLLLSGVCCGIGSFLGCLAGGICGAAGRTRRVAGCICSGTSCGTCCIRRSGRARAKGSARNGRRRGGRSWCFNRGRRRHWRSLFRFTAGSEGHGRNQSGENERVLHIEIPLEWIKLKIAGAVYREPCREYHRCAGPFSALTKNRL
jgi:hypothetical protein